MVVFSGTRVKAWSSLQRKFQMISEWWKFLSPFLIFAMSAVQIFKVKKTSTQRLHPPFCLKDQNWGGGGMPPLRILQPDGQAGLHQIQNMILKCSFSLQSALYRGAELPLFYTAVSKRKRTLPSAFQGRRPVLAAIDQDARMAWKGSQ